MWWYSKSKCAKQAVLILKNLLLVTPQRPYGFDEKGPFSPFFEHLLQRIQKVGFFPYSHSQTFWIYLKDAIIYVHVHILWSCPDMQHAETHAENLFTVMRHNHALIPEGEDSLTSFTRRSCSLWDDTVGAPISARFYWKETEWIWTDRYLRNSSRIYSSSGKVGPFSLYLHSDAEGKSINGNYERKNEKKN